MDFLASLKKLLGQGEQQSTPQRTMAQQEQRPLPNPRATLPSPDLQVLKIADRMGQRVQQRPGLYPYPGGKMLYGAESDGRLQEDQFTFPQGGSFDRLGDGRARINGGFIPRNGGLQEDDFTFPRY